MTRAFVRRLAAATLLAHLPLGAQTAPAATKPLLTPAGYGRFESMSGQTLSPDGRSLAYVIRRVDETSELRVRALVPGRMAATDSTRVLRWGSAPRFSSDSRWVAWSIGLPPQERTRLERERRPIRLRAGVLDLRTGAERTFDAVRAMAFDATGRYVALQGYAPDEPRGKGADLRVIDLAQGSELTLGNVGEFSWSDVGSLLAVTTATGAAAGNGVQVYDAPNGRLQNLDGSGSTYRQLAWRKNRPDLAVLRSVKPAATAPAAGPATPAALGATPAAPVPNSGRQMLLAWRALDGAAPARMQLDSIASGLADTLEIAEFYRPRWSDDGRLLAVGLRPVSRAQMALDSATRARVGAARRDSVRRDSTLRRDSLPEAAPRRPDSTRARLDATRPTPDTARRDTTIRAADEELPAMQLWHTNDVKLIPEQQVQANQRAQRTLLAVWDPAAKRVVQVGSSLPEGAALLDGWHHAIETVDAPYPWGAKFGRSYEDVTLVDLATGARRTMLDSVRYAWPSAAGRYVLSFDGKDYWTDDVRTGAHRNVTRGISASFADTAYDTPTDMLPPFGVGGWTDGDRALFVYDENDVWRISPDGAAAAVRLTRGREDSVTHRLVRVDTARRTFDPKVAMYVSLHGEWTERRGIGRILPNGTVERLVYLDQAISQPVRADKAEVFAYTAEARDDSPDLFVGGPTLRDAVQVTATNPFLRDYAWTHEEIVRYTSESGRKLEGVLLYPANHDPSKTYPMITYAYELLSPTAHQFQVPSEQSYYNFTAWTQQGYFVLMPDIVFRAREPGVSTIEAVRPAVKSIVDRGLVDGAKVGFIGHSFGGYESAYLATHTNGLFAATVAGAPLTDFVSFMGQLHWTPGIAELSHWETGQARMAVPYWEDPAAHERNSPVHTVQKMTTPLLLAHGNEDGVVQFSQSTELFNFARRAGKQVVLLVYEGENHGFVKKANQIDYHRRILEWFGYYLKGEPAPAWITNGVPLDDMAAEKRRVARRATALIP